MAEHKGAGTARVAVLTSAGQQEASSSLARELSLPIVDDAAEASVRFDLLLVLSGTHVELREARPAAPGPVWVDFVGGSVGHRGRTVRSRREPLARAIGLRSGVRSVVDATAGLGRDAFHLACLGCKVTAVERSGVMAALLRDGLARAGAEGDERLAAIVERIALVVGDARDVLPTLAGELRPDAVYLDPMYAPKKKSALAKKEMRICRLLVGDDVDAVELLDVARRVACRRVVVKRHRRAPALAPHPSTKYVGTTVRYDVYRIP